MISFGPLSITLLIGAAQGAFLALMLLRASVNRTANRFLALLIVAVALMITPYIIGFAGFYDAYPWLSFAPFQTGLAFGPLIYFHVLSLTGGPLPSRWPVHFAPYLVQFLAQAVVFPLSLETKDWWDGFAHAPFISPALTMASLASMAVYGRLAWRRYQDYLAFLAATRTDGSRFDPSWIRNAIIAIFATVIIWLGFFLADLVDPSRNYFDQFWMYVGLSLVAIYLGVEGWRNATLPYPPLTAEPPPAPAPTTSSSGEATQRNWGDQAAIWTREIEAAELWRDPDLTLGSLARTLGTNTTYLSRALNEGLGLTFSAFINSRRVEEVKRLLADPSVSEDILALALQAGFSSKATFNRAFADLTGVTPSAYRRNARLKS